MLGKKTLTEHQEDKNHTELLGEAKKATESIKILQEKTLPTSRLQFCLKTRRFFGEKEHKIAEWKFLSRDRKTNGNS